jgi:hypothetical protein
VTSFRNSSRYVKAVQQDFTESLTSTPRLDASRGDKDPCMSFRESQVADEVVEHGQQIETLMMCLPWVTGEKNTKQFPGQNSE